MIRKENDFGLGDDRNKDILSEDWAVPVRKEDADG